MRLTTNIAETVQVLRDGGVIAYPTDTCYGLSCDAANEWAVEKIYLIKGMDKNKPVTILVENLEAAKGLGEFGEEALELAEKHWPGALTIIVNRKDDEGTVGLRVAGDKVSAELLAGFGGALTTTSANLTGNECIYSSDAVLEEFSGQEYQPDLVLDIKVEGQQKPSTIVDCTGSEKKIIRLGDLGL